MSESNAEADNYSSISFSAFAEDWNKWVTSLGYTHSTVTYKTASHLQQAFKVAKKSANKKATICPHREDINALKQNLRDKGTNREFLLEFAPAVMPQRTCSTSNAK